MGNISNKETPYRQLLAESPVAITITYGSINSINELETPSPEALIVGTSLGGRMSAVRRFFCLLTTFDLLFTVLLWLISTMVRGYTVKEAFTREVQHYSIQSSFFDIVMVSAVRFTVIILAYALFRLSHWWAVALTTAGSGGFILSKVFFYDWIKGNQTVSIVLLTCSFIISWGEAWFLDFRVLPYEDKASLLLARQVNDRVPIIPSARRSRAPSEDDQIFYSPPESGGESEDDERCNVTLSLSPQEQAYKNEGLDAIERALDIISHADWRTEKVSGNDIVQSKVIPKNGKVFKFVGVINMNPSRILEAVFNNVNAITSWNPTVKAMKLLQKIDDHTDIVYIVAAEGAGGLVTSRDFINIRSWQKRGDAIVLGMKSIHHPQMPVQKAYIRGEQGPSAYVLMPVSDDTNRCQMQWLLNTNLKGWIPQYVVDQGISGAILDAISYMRQYAETLELQT